MYEIFLFFFLIFNSTSGQMIFPDSKIFFSNNNVPYGVGSDARYTSQDYDHFNNINTVNTHSEQDSISDGIINFALNINKIMLNSMNEPVRENIVLSPLSLVGALSLVTLGSVGKTYNELAKVLGFFDDINTSRNKHRQFGLLLDKIKGQGSYSSMYANNMRNLSYGSAVFLQNQYPIKQQYENIVQNIYKSEITHVDFQNNAIYAQEIINKWVFDQTKGKIQNIISNAPSPDTRLVIASALYFGAEWECHFFDDFTKKSPFTPNVLFPYQTINVDMMANEGVFPYYKSEEHECMILGLPYKGNKTTLYVIKPLDSTKKNLKQVLNDLTAEILKSLINNAIRQSTIVLFPKMKLSSTHNLRSVLENMGIKSVFSNIEANLAHLSASPTAYMPNTNMVLTKEEDEKFIFSRFGEDHVNQRNCEQVFQFKNSITANCTVSDVVNGEKIQVVYKRIGNQIGRKVIKREIITNEFDNKNTESFHRIRRQSNLWNPGLYVDEVLHKVDMDITETGTEAASSTVVFVTRDGRRPVFKADEPFFFLIIDEDTNIPLFSSIIYNPTLV